MHLNIYRKKYIDLCIKMNMMEQVLSNGSLDIDTVIRLMLYPHG